MDSAATITVADLLRHRLPISGAASLRPSSPFPPPPKKHKPHHHAPPLPSNPLPFSPLPHPTILTGTISLPSDASHAHCLSFSDASSAVCCAVLSLDTAVLNHTVQVLAFNFLPFKHTGGILEIIRWRLTSIHPPSTAPVHRTCAGALRAVSPVFRVPSHNQNHPDSQDSIGFLAEIATGKCETKYVYFIGTASRWRAVMCGMVGEVVSVSGLKKKQVFVGEEAYVMLVGSAETVVVGGCRLPAGVACGNRRREGVMYVGVVSGVYMQGMVVELDEKVWVLITDPMLAPQHSLRVGTIISVRNFHVARPKFSWTKVLLLGSCSRTSIDVRSFSLSDSRCYSRKQSQSLLGKFIESLAFSAQFWVLLLVACFRRKFAGIFSDKEILGSQNNEGLVHIYARTVLPSCPVRHQHGVFMEFCKHDQCICKSDWNVDYLRLVIPISNFLGKCEAIWMSILSHIHNDAKAIEVENNGNHLPCEGPSYSRMIRKIIPSEDLGFVLMGSLKVSSTSRRLQLVDATGSVDIVVPDLLSTVDCSRIHEVMYPTDPASVLHRLCPTRIKDYKVVIEGLPTQPVSLGSHSTEPLSCRSIFQQFPYKKLPNKVAVYVHFYVKDSTCINVSSALPPSMVRRVDLKENLGETFHLLLVTHKFPDSVNDDPSLSKTSSSFAEALFFPYNLILSKEHECNELPEMFRDTLPHSDYVEKQKDPDIGSSWRPKLNLRTRAILAGAENNSEKFETRPSKVPCLLTFTSKFFEDSSLPGYLCHTDGSALENMPCNRRARRILLEFLPDSFCKFHVLHYGACYILGCSNIEGCEEMSSGKAIVNSKTALWNFSFSFGDIMHHKELPVDQSSGVYSARDDKTVSRSFCHNELIFQPTLSKMGGASDVHLHFASEDTRLVKEETEAVKDWLTRILPEKNDVLSVSSCIQQMDEFAIPFAAAYAQSSKLPKGNLISVSGDIENIHSYNCKYKPYGTPEQSNIDERKSCSICIHVFDDQHMVQICGDLSNYTRLVGMGPGANATFHRVLMMCCSSRWLKLVLTPVSYVVINSVKEFGYQHRERSSLSSLRCNILEEESVYNISLALFSQLRQSTDSRLTRFRCRVVTVSVLVLEEHAVSFVKSQSSSDFRMTAVKIPLAGFVLDDGSSLCYCWADGGRAETFLSLHETTPHTIHSSQKRSKKAGNIGSQYTAGYHLGKILKKHHRVVARNHGAATDSSYQDFTFTVNSDEIFSNSEESLLRFIILSACAGPSFNIVGYPMDSNAFEWLSSELSELQISVRSMKNVWVREVAYVNPLNEARNLLHSLVDG